MTSIVTHRGIDADQGHLFPESSREAFTHFLRKGFGIEFDVCVTKDAIPVISHDKALTRATGGTNQDLIVQITAEAFLNVPLEGGSTLTLEELVSLIKTEGLPDAIHALHLKHYNQTEDQLAVLIPYLCTLPATCIVFDVTAQTAALLKQKVPDVQLAASVSHAYDRARYNAFVGDTLMTIEDVIANRSLFDWAWMDEWDCIGENDVEKKLYSPETFAALREHDFKIAVVSPELHATSPHLLGGESHPDGRDSEAVARRWNEIAALAPDAICTDYPDRYATFSL